VPKYFEHTIVQNIYNDQKIKKDTAYSLEELLLSMIQDSNNIATTIVSNYVSQEDLLDLLSSLGVSIEKEGVDVGVRVKDFASMFRVLYNASYLNREMSEKALSLLATSSFSKGIVAGVPAEIKVAHKFGERMLQDIQTGRSLQKQLHDCGIIYTENPYILCVMTQGNDFEKQANFIADISTFFYTHR
jgi:beta-lactamase class A